ncbi:MAG: hypothetical protein ACO3BD_00080 [Chitinophagaceae bacterium]
MLKFSNGLLSSILLFAFILKAPFIVAQQADSVPQKDVMDIVGRMLGVQPTTEEELTRVANKPFHFSVLPGLGYTLQTRVAAAITGNAAFYTTPDKQENLSTVYAGITYTQNKQLVTQAINNIWTRNNRFNFSTDLRYMKYPQSTFGLGGKNDKILDENPMDFQYLRFYQTALTKMGKSFYGGIGYYLDYHFNISEAGYPNGRVSDFTLYSPVTKSFSSGLGLILLADGRDNPINPSKGYYGQILYRDHSKALGSDDAWQSLLIDLRKYIPIKGKRQNVLAFWTYNWIVLKGKAPYLALPSTSWDPFTNTGRGYIQGRFRSTGMLYAESEYRFGITRNGMIGGVVFANVQSFEQWPNRRFAYVQPAVGGGLRFKINKYTKTNVSIDYGFGANGSRGLFINMGELF